MNAIKNMQLKYSNYKSLDAKDKRTFWKETAINNAMYVLLIIAIIYTFTQNHKFLSTNSIVNIISLSAANLPIACGIAGCIVLTGTDLSAGRVVGLTACISASLLQSLDYASKMFPNMKRRLGKRIFRGKVPAASVHCNAGNTVDSIWYPVDVYHDQRQ